MAIDINSVVVGKLYGIMSKGQKIKVSVTKVNKRAGTVDIKNANGKVVAGVAVDKLKGLQGRPPVDASAKAAPVKAPVAAPKAAPAKAPAAPAPKASNKKALPFADLVERIRDVQNRWADASNELAELVEQLDAMEPAAETAPAKGKGRNKPMADEDAPVEDDGDEIEFE